MNSINSLLGKVKPFVVLVAMVLAMCAMTGCKPGDYNINTSLNARDASPEEKGRADLLYAQADHQRMQTEQEQQRAQIETNILAETAKLNQQLSAEQRRAEIQANIAKSNAEVQVSLVNADAWSRFITSVSYGLVIGLVVIAYGGGLSLAVIAIGRSAAHIKHQWAMADNLLIQAANRDLPPLIFTRSGYMIDTLTGERAKLSSPAQVSQLRTAAMTRLLEASALAHAASDIGRDNRRRRSGGVQAADAIPGIAASIPLVFPAHVESEQ